MGVKALTPKVNAREAVHFYPYYTAQYFVALVVFALIFARAGVFRAAFWARTR